MVKEFPESGLVRKTFTIRQMDFPPEVSLTKRSLVRWFALAFGLISPRESRSKILDVLDALFYFQVTKKEFPRVLDLLEYLQKNKRNVDEKSLRYHLKSLLDLGLLEWRGKRLSLVFGTETDMADIAAGFESKILKEINSSLILIQKSLEGLKFKYNS